MPTNRRGAVFQNPGFTYSVPIFFKSPVTARVLADNGMPFSPPGFFGDKLCTFARRHNPVPARNIFCPYAYGPQVDHSKAHRK